MKLKVGRRAPDFTLPCHLGKDASSFRIARQDRCSGLLPASLDASLNWPNPVLRGASRHVCGIECPGSGHKH